MRLKHSVRESSAAKRRTLCSALGQSHGLLAALFQSSTVGVAIFDRELRYRAVNDALASMNGIPADAHLGKTLHAVLGDAATKVQPACEHVFATGQPLCNFEIVAELPSRGAVGHWNESCFPIKDQAGQVQEVGFIVLELTKRDEIDSALLRLTDKLTRIISAWHEPVAPDAVNSGGDFRGIAGVLARSVMLLESCLSETRAISDLLQPPPHQTTVQPLDADFAANAASFSAEPGRHSLRTGRAECSGPLSAREREVTALLADGKSNKQIGSLLAISTRTVESHRARIMLKLDLHSVTDLVRYAVRSHLIQP